MIASLGIWGIDRGVRLVRTALIHVGYLDGSKGMFDHSTNSFWNLLQIMNCSQDSSSEDGSVWQHQSLKMWSFRDVCRETELQKCATNHDAL